MSDEKGQADPKSATSLVARGGIINILGNVIGVLDPIFMIVVSRALGAGILGSYVLAATYVVMLQSLGVLGLDSGLLRHVPMARSSEDRNVALASLIGTSLRITLAISLVGTLVVFFLADEIVAAGGDDAMGDGAMWLSWMVLALPGRALSQLFLFALRGASRMGAFVVVNHIVLPGLLLIIALPAIAFGAGAPSLIVAYVASSYIGAAVSYLLFRKTFHELAFADIIRAPHDPALVRFSVPQGLTDLLNFLLARVDILMIAAFFPHEPELVAVYAIASLLAATVKKVRQAFDTSFAPVFSGLLVGGNSPELSVLYARVTRWTYALFMLLAGGICLAAPILLVAFGEEYVAYWPAVPILVAGRWLNAAGGPAQMALLMAGRSRLEFVNNVAINVLNIALNLALIVRYGVLGAAMATSLSLLLFNAVRVYQVFRLVRVQPDWGEVLRVTLAAAAALLPSLAILSIGFDGRIWLTALAGMLYLLTYPLALYAFGFREDVRAGLSAVRAWAARRRARRVPA